MEKKNLRCYHNTYIEKYVLLWEDVLDTFLNTCLKQYMLDPVISTHHLD